MILKRKSINSIKKDDDLDLFNDSDDELDNKLNKDSDDELDKDLDLNDDSDLFNENLDFDGDSGTPPMEKHKDLLLKLTDFSPYLKTQIMEWLGKYWDDEKSKYVEDPLVKPMMNIKGARWCINFLRTYTRDNNIITTISEETFKNIMLDVIYTCTWNIGTRAEEFDIKSNGDIMAIANQIIHATELVLTGSGGKKAYVDFLSTTISRHENVNTGDRNENQNQNQRSKGFINGLKQYMGGG